MGAFATSTDHTADGRIIRVDPVTGQQSIVSSGNLLVDPAGLTLAPERADLRRGERRHARHPERDQREPGDRCADARDAGRAALLPVRHRRGGGRLAARHGLRRLLRRQHGRQLRVRLRRADPDRRGHPRPVDRVEQRARVGQPLPQPARRGRSSRAAGCSSSTRTAATALVAVDPDSGVQDAETPNTATDRIEVPQRAALTPDGDVVLSDFTLDDQEGGLISVDLPDGAQSILRQNKQLFNNPLGVAVVANRAPVAAVSASPAVVAPGRTVTFDASGSSDPEGLGAPVRVGPRRERQLRDRGRHEPDDHEGVLELDHADRARARERPARRDRRRRDARAGGRGAAGDQPAAGPRRDPSRTGSARRRA